MGRINRGEELGCLFPIQWKGPEESGHPRACYQGKGRGLRWTTSDTVADWSAGLSRGIGMSLCRLHLLTEFSLPNCPRGLNFTWWGCCSLYFQHKLTELAHSFFLLFYSCVCVCLYGPFNCISFHKFSRQLSAFPLLFYSILVSVSVFMALSTVFLSINSPDNSPLSHSVLPVLFLPYWSFQLYISLWKSPSALI